MSTTAVVAEIVIVGLEAEAWLAALVIVIFGSGWIDVAELAKFDAVVLLAVVAAAYALGVVVDRVADGVFRRPATWTFGRWLNRVFGKGSDDWRLPGDVSEMRLAVMRAGGGPSAFVDYQRSRIRVARGTVVNLAVAVVVATLYFGKVGDWWNAVRIDAFLVGLLAVALPASERIHTAWLDRLCDAYTAVAGDIRAIVAAVPVTGSGADRRFLIVKTKGEQHWTFPKGHVKKDEQKRKAVARELGEEGGVEGEVASSAFTTYRYPPTRRGERDATTVRAYLVRVPERVPPRPREPAREPTWVTREEAEERLTMGRDDETAAEHRRVLAEAVRLLEAEEEG